MIVFMAIYKVYKITNRLNRKIYVGQTKQAIEKRFGSPLEQAMRQCGADNFTIEVIEEVPNGYNVINVAALNVKPTSLQIYSCRFNKNIDPCFR